ncbi:MAG TPA: glycosyltransferase family 4 protein [Terracidiphilus sp.]|nr:glycosyltransferase family 4 protein [Terracidiphilus sp.]
MAKLVFLWDNFGPLHADRCDAVAEYFGRKHQVVGIELASRSKVYDWVPESGSRFQKVTLVEGRSVEEISGFQLFRKTLRACLSMGRNAHFFICHYQAPPIFLCAVVLRMMGRRVYAIGCSKFDDYARDLRREVAKSFLYLPYNGGIASGIRSTDYMRFLGIAVERVKSPYNAVSLARIRKMAGVPPAPEGVPFAERHFTIVARLVAKKNLSMALKAFALYCAQTANPRSLHLFGTGPLEAQLREQAQADGIAVWVHFRGFQQTQEVSEAYGRSLAVLLPSIEEQFGNVVPEAMGMGLPVILSDNCGARDLLIRSGVNGFVIEPDNPEGMAYFMKLIAEDEQLWRRLAKSAREFAELSDSPRFAEAVAALIGEMKG